MRGVWFARILVLILLSFSVYGAIIFGEEEPNDSGAEATPTNEKLDGPETESADDAPADTAEPLDWAEADGTPPETSNPLIYLFGGVGGLLLLLVSAIFVEFIGVIMLVALVVPMISQRKKHKEDQMNRGRILGYIEANAGIHFSALRDGIDLANGVTAYHTNELERAGKIFSWKSGKHRRYASSILDKDQRKNIRNPLSGTRLAILEVLAESGQLGLESKELRQRLQISRQLLSHHIKELRTTAMIEPAERSKRAWRASVYGQEQLHQSRTFQEAPIL